VSGWKVFGLVPSGREASGRGMPDSVAARQADAPVSASFVRTSKPALAPSPELLQGTASTSHGTGTGGTSRRRMVTTLVSGGGIQPIQGQKQDRAKGIGSRFRTASNDSGHAFSRFPGKGSQK
jgi:type IV secretion system protein VirB6